MVQSWQKHRGIILSNNLQLLLYFIYTLCNLSFCPGPCSREGNFFGHNTKCFFLFLSASPFSYFSGPTCPRVLSPYVILINSIASIIIGMCRKPIQGAYNSLVGWSDECRQVKECLVHSKWNHYSKRKRQKKHFFDTFLAIKTWRCEISKQDDKVHTFFLT